MRVPAPWFITPVCAALAVADQTAILNYFSALGQIHKTTQP